MNHKKIIKKVSFNMSVISATLLGGYILCENPINSSQFIFLSTTLLVSAVGYNLDKIKVK